jgi:ribosomal protein S27E
MLKFNPMEWNYRWWHLFCQPNKKRRLPTKARPEGTVIRCQKCKKYDRVYHFAWTALVCPNCHREVSKNDWYFSNDFQSLSDKR